MGAISDAPRWQEIVRAVLVTRNFLVFADPLPLIATANKQSDVHLLLVEPHC